MFGKFIVLEGLDGVGKSVQSDLLVKRLKELGKDVILVRAPGGTEEGKVIRQLVLSKGVSPVTEMLLFAADRAELAYNVILPALKRGTWVVSDRYLDSSRAYQGALGHDYITSETIEKLHADFISECEPDLTILLSASKEETYKRMNERGSSDLIEDRNSDYRSRVEKEFTRIALTDKKRPHVSVSTDNAIRETSDKILRAVKDHFKL